MFGVQEIDAATLQQRLAQGEKLRLIDVRSEAEFAQGIIPGGEFMPLHTVPLKLDELKASADPIVFYCRSGQRSAQACLFLKQNTGVEALNLYGGIIAWYQAGNPIAHPNKAA
ncbi:rhodanese-like domain-containing protein [Thiofilum flexile]|uniref:rhodanese-like domain-containing protein n=1 Tax=Thiofilum flexile TaxID=125627 RepID=UPI00036216E5|nr:rhodanese-like domain-containing protein [Thiofilum flexile]